MSLLELKNISKAYRDGSSELKVLNDLKLKLDDSEICIIMGPSGSGKTTLLNIAGTLDSPNDGIVKINGSRLDYQNQDLCQVQLFLLLNHFETQLDVAIP